MKNLTLVEIEKNPVNDPLNNNVIIKMKFINKVGRITEKGSIKREPIPIKNQENTIQRPKSSLQSNFMWQ
jgi:hypothetical protein